MKMPLVGEKEKRIIIFPIHIGPFTTENIIVKGSTIIITYIYCIFYLFIV